MRTYSTGEIVLNMKTYSTYSERVLNMRTYSIGERVLMKKQNIHESVLKNDKSRILMNEYLKT